MSSLRNPKWTKDETILALDVYFKTHIPQFSPQNPEILDLSELLNRLPIHPIESRKETFRNPAGIYMKLCNFLRCDPNYTKEGYTGLPNGSHLEIEVWEEFSENRDYLSKVAAAIKTNVDQLEESDPDISNDFYDDEAPEGRILFAVHRRRERNLGLSRRKKSLAMQRYGKLFCQICDFVFTEKYGDIGEGFIEAHHKIPLSELPSGTVITKLSDLVLVCSNCHRMLHRKGGTETIDSLKSNIITGDL